MICPAACGISLQSGICECATNVYQNRAAVFSAMPELQKSLRVDPPTKVFKDDSAKLRMLFPPEAYVAINEVFDYGARTKYGPHMWESNPIEWSRIADALERHYFKRWKQGHDRDVESDLLELAHIAANAVMLLQYELKKIGTDDRYKGGK